MSDKTTIGPSPLLRQYIEALVKEVMLEGKTFDNQKKNDLQRYSQDEGVDYATLEKDIESLFRALNRIKTYKSQTFEQFAKKVAKNCYLEQNVANELISAMNEAREMTKRKAKEMAERKAKEDEVREAKAKAEREAWEMARLKKKEEILKGKEEVLKGKEEVLKGKEKTLKGKEEALKVKEEALKAKEEAIYQKERDVTERKSKEAKEQKAKEEVEKRINENFKKLQELQNKANAMIDGMTQQQQEDRKTLAALNNLNNQLRIYLDKTKKQSAPAANPIHPNWSAYFIEQLRQAYCRKDLVFLENAFSPNAQIMSGAFENNNNSIRYRTQGKQQYITNLRSIFGKNKTIDVRFEADLFTGMLYSSADGRCQVIRLLQRWRSNNYSDNGYLFLVLYYDQYGPKVYIRAWQPEYIGGRHITLQELNGINNVTGLL